MTKIISYKIDGAKDEEIELPLVFSTPFRRELIHKAWTNLNSHRFQRQGRHPTAGMDVVADTNTPPTGQGIARIARMQGGGGGRQGQAGEVASTRGGRQAHPPNVYKVIYKKLNKKENKLALCSAIAATGSKELITSRGHKVDEIDTFPIIVSNELETISKAAEVSKVIQSLKLSKDVERLQSRKPRSGQALLRGRPKKIGKSILFVTKEDKNIRKACGTIPGVEARSVKNLSVLDLSPGSEPIRLTVYTKGAIEEIGKIKSNHLKLMEKTK